MRLDEWQKYIQAQFLEDETEPTHMIGSQVADPGIPHLDSVDVSESVQTERQRVEVEVSSQLPNELSQSNCQQSLSLNPINVLVPLEPVWDNAIYLPRSEQSPESIRHLQKGKPEDSASLNNVAPSPTVEVYATPAFSSIVELSTEIPSFERYLPPSYRRLEVTRESTLEADDVRTRHNDEPDTSNDIEMSEALPRPRRLPRASFRQTGKMVPEPVPAYAASNESWSGASKYAPLLLALERLDEEREVAQSSYKKPFQEKRRELIQRLLDPILTLEEAARLLNVCPTTVRRYTNKGILTYYRKEPASTGRTELRTEKETRQRRFRLSDILNFLGTQQTTIRVEAMKEEQRFNPNMNVPQGPVQNSDPENRPGIDENRSQREEVD